jgi:hypothetical protein
LEQPFYQVKGALPANAPSYIKREADNALYDALIKHQYCYVLNYRQVGKSSLKNNCAKRLEKRGHHCIHIDLTEIGSKDIEVEQWYFSFMHIIVKSLNLSEQTFVNYWLNQKLTVVSRVALVIDELILKEIQNNITIFIDEIDFILSINKFNTDNFFALIRRFYNLRGEDERYNRLTFVLLGVASAKNLMQDSSRTPFNIAENIIISQLKLEQSYRLIDGLEKQTIDKKEILKKVFEYTSGTSFLTQKILDYIARNPIKSLDEIEKIVDLLFFQEEFNEVNLSNVQERIIKNQTHNVKMLYVIEKILHGVEIEDDGRRQTYIYLKLSGLIKEESGLLVYSNLIYQKIFNERWLDKMIDKLDRPIIKYLQKWTQHNMSKKYLLRNETLQEIVKWADKRDDLLADEHNYLSLSHQEENRKERKKFNRMVWFFVLTLFLAVGGNIYYSYSKEEAYKLKQKKEIKRIENQKIKIENEKIKINLENKARDDYYRRLLKAKLKKGTIEYYLWEIDTYEHIKEDWTYEKIAEASIHLGRLYKNSQKSKKYYLKALEIYKKDKNKYQNKIAEIYYEIASTDKSLIYYNKALEIYNKNPYRYRGKRAEIYYSIADIAIFDKNITEANKYYQKGFRLYNSLIEENPSKYIDKLAKSFYEKAKIYRLKKDNKRAIEFARKAKNIYNKIDSKIYSKEITNFIKKLPKVKTKKSNRIKGYVYLGKYVNGNWQKQNFCIAKMDELDIEGSSAIAINSISFRKKASVNSKKLKNIVIGDIVKIIEIEKRVRDKDIYVWAKVIM